MHQAWITTTFVGGRTTKASPVWYYTCWIGSQTQRLGSRAGLRLHERFGKSTSGLHPDSLSQCEFSTSQTQRDFVGITDVWKIFHLWGWKGLMSICGEALPLCPMGRFRILFWGCLLQVGKCYVWSGNCDRLLITGRWGSELLHRDKEPFNTNFSSAAAVGVTLSLSLSLWLYKSRLSTQSPLWEAGLLIRGNQLKWKHL